jgi:phosphate transport system substrate-binding protein
VEKAYGKGLVFDLIPIGKEAFVFFVNKANPVDAVSSHTIRMIYSGNVVNWNEIGGKNSPIRAFQRPQNSGSQTIFEKIMAGEKIIDPLTNVIRGMGEMIQEVADYKNHDNAIGYSFMFFTTEMVHNNFIKLLAVDNIYPAPDTIQSDTYPFIATIFAITAGGKSENAEKFIDWILSEEGQYLVKKTGYSAIN